MTAKTLKLLITLFASVMILVGVAAAGLGIANYLVLYNMRAWDAAFYGVEWPVLLAIVAVTVPGLVISILLIVVCRRALDEARPPSARWRLTARWLLRLEAALWAFGPVALAWALFAHPADVEEGELWSAPVDLILAGLLLAASLHAGLKRPA